MVQSGTVTLNRTCSLLLIVALSGCSNANEGTTSEQIVHSQNADHSDDPGYGNPQHIAAPFRYVFEESSVELCSASVTQDAPACLHDSRRCWLIFDDKANKDMDLITKQHFIAEEGTYWIEGVGRITTASGGFGHQGAYECQVQMTSVSRFVKMPS
jgi:hypothetical protein